MIYVYDERYPKNGRVFVSISELREYAHLLNINEKDWGMWSDDNPPMEATISEMAETLYGEWGRHKEGARYIVRDRWGGEGKRKQSFNTYGDAKSYLATLDVTDDLFGYSNDDAEYAIYDVFEEKYM